MPTPYEIFDKTPIIANGHMFQRHCKAHKSYEADTSFFTDKTGAAIDVDTALVLINDVKSLAAMNSGGVNKSKPKFDTGLIRVRSLAQKPGNTNTAIAITAGYQVGNDGSDKQRECQWLVLVTTGKLNNTGRYDWVSCYPVTEYYVNLKAK